MEYYIWENENIYCLVPSIDLLEMDFQIKKLMNSGVCEIIIEDVTKRLKILVKLSINFYFVQILLQLKLRFNYYIESSEKKLIIKITQVLLFSTTDLL